MLINTRVTDDVDAVNRRRFAFVHAHLKVYRVTRYGYLHRINIEEQIASVSIEFCHSVIVRLQTLVQQLQVIYVAFLDAQRHIQVLVRINGIAHPRDIPHVVFLTLADGHVDVHAIRVIRIRHHAIRHNIRVTITDLVVLLDNRRLVFLVLFGHELFRAEQVRDMVIVGLLHRMVNLRMRQRLVTRDINLPDLRLHFLIDVDSHFHVAHLIAVWELQHLYFGIVETFLRKVFLDDGFRAVAQVRRHLRAFRDANFHLKVFFLTFLQTVIHHFGHARTRSKRYL